MSNEPVRQHFVPQFLLRNFAEGRKNKARLWVFDKQTRKSFGCPVRDVAQENRFYEAKNIDGHHLKAEQLTQKIDSAGGAVIRAIVESEVLLPNLDSRGHLAMFLGAQLVRGPTTRNLMGRWTKRIIEKWGPDVHLGEDPRPISAYSEDDNRHASIDALRDVPVYARLLNEKIWFLTRSTGPTCFTLSDNPLVAYNEIQRPHRGNLGLSRVGIEYRLPLTPRLCLNLVCPSVAQKIQARNGPIFSNAATAGRPLNILDENVIFANSLQVLDSERFLYALHDADFALARDMIRENALTARPSSQMWNMT